MHAPVLLKETIEVLDPAKGETALDCTINNAGHSLGIAARLGRRGRLIGLDEDKNALSRAGENLAGSGPEIILEESNFRNLDKVLQKHGLDQVDKILFDLGISSDQLESSGRGFSFNGDEPLLMTLGVVPRSGQATALEIVNGWSEEELNRIVRDYGEERKARRIAEAIVEARKKEVIKTTGELSRVIARAVGGRRGRINPATKTFQAIRIAVNDELEALREGLKKAAAALSPGGRMAVISFHSLEDRIVKNYFRELISENKFRLLNKKVIKPEAEELKRNPRARSAKLRAIERIK